MTLLGEQVTGHMHSVRGRSPANKEVPVEPPGRDRHGGGARQAISAGSRNEPAGRRHRKLRFNRRVASGPASAWPLQPASALTAERSTRQRETATLLYASSGQNPSADTALTRCPAILRQRSGLVVQVITPWSCGYGFPHSWARVGYGNFHQSIRVQLSLGVRVIHPTSWSRCSVTGEPVLPNAGNGDGGESVDRSGGGSRV